MTSVRWLRSVDEVASCAPLLRRLVAASDRDLPAADPDFLARYVSHFEYGPSPTPELLIAEREGTPIGFLATRLGRRVVSGRFSVRERSLLVTHDHDRANLVSAPSDRSEAAAAIAGELVRSVRRTALDISGLIPGEPLHRALHRAAHSDIWATSFDIDLPSYCTVPVRYLSVQEYFRALSKTMRSNVSRQARRLFAAGEVAIIRAHGAGEVERLFPCYLDLEQRSWKYEAQAGILRAPKRTAFFGEIVAGRCGYEPSLVGISLNGVLIAALILGRSGNSMWALEMAFDAAYGSLGAGQLLLVLAMAEAIAQGTGSLGYLQHFSYFKTRWLAEETGVVSTRVVATGSPLHVRRLSAELLARRTRPDVLTETPAARVAETDGSGQVQHQALRAAGRPGDAEASAELLRRRVNPASLVTGPDAAALLPFPVR